MSMEFLNEPINAMIEATEDGYSLMQRDDVTFDVLDPDHSSIARIVQAGNAFVPRPVIQGWKIEGSVALIDIHDAFSTTVDLYKKGVQAAIQSPLEQEPNRTYIVTNPNLEWLLFEYEDGERRRV